MEWRGKPKYFVVFLLQVPILCMREPDRKNPHRGPERVGDGPVSELRTGTTEPRRK